MSIPFAVAVRPAGTDGAVVSASVVAETWLDDEFVPSGPGRRLAAERPDLVTFVPWREARHCKEWNVDPQRWSRVVGEFVERP